uniref:hypothetical protein n=1 Tax=Armatimonas sp. TaxID=1872638 RepID=UPI00286B2ADA
MSYYIDNVQNRRMLLFECISESGEKSTYTLFEYLKKESDSFDRLKFDWLKDSGKTNMEKDYPISMAKPEYLASEIPRTLDRYISNSVKSAPFSMIGRFKITRYSSTPSEKPKSVNQLIQYLDEKSEIWYKWNEDTLLLCDYSRFLDNDSNRPAWTTVKSLRVIIKKSPDNLLPIDSLFDLSVKLTSGQLDRLGEDFKGLSWVARLQPFFQYSQN